MNHMVFYTAGQSDGLTHAVELLKAGGIPFSEEPTPAVTHLLLPVPAFSPDGRLKGGSLSEILPRLPRDITVLGGNLACPELSGFRTLDLLQDIRYIAENANITAYCALSIAMQRLPVTLRECPCLVIGWGRIGKCLARLLRNIGARVYIAARKEADRAMAQALDLGAVDIPAITPEHYRLIFNTAPEMVLPDCPGNALKIDLASRPGISGSDVVWARGLPGLMAPESSGKLIAETVLRLVR